MSDLIRLLCIPLFTLGVLPAVSFAQAPPLALAGIAHVALRVGDIDRSTTFYRQLGFQVAFAMSKNGKPTEVFIKINDRQFIELYPQRDLGQPVGFMHICFESSDLPTLQSAYVAEGLTPTVVKKAGAGNLLFTMPGPEQQNIEYTQYMPGSMHTNDHGLHLGANRIALQFIGVTIPMANPANATLFYQQKLGFTQAHAAADTQSLRLPGPSGEFLQFAPSFRLLFSVPDIRRTVHTLKAMHLTVHKDGKTAETEDPNGNQLLFVKGTP